MNRGLRVSLSAALLVPLALGNPLAHAGGHRASVGSLPKLDVMAGCRESSVVDCLGQERLAYDMLSRIGRISRARKKIDVPRKSNIPVLRAKSGG